MAQLSNKIKEYCKANGVSNVDFLNDVKLQDDMVGGVSNPYIKEWNLNIPQPTTAQLDALDAQADFNVAITNLRAKRNKLLQETDHYALSDQTLSDDMRTYRQSLRDITENLTTVEQVKAVEFPTKP